MHRLPESGGGPGELCQRSCGPTTVSNLNDAHGCHGVNHLSNGAPSCQPVEPALSRAGSSSLRSFDIQEQRSDGQVGAIRMQCLSAAFMNRDRDQSRVLKLHDSRTDLCPFQRTRRLH